MRHVRLIKTAFLIAGAVTIFGCSKDEAPATGGGGAAPGSGAVKSISGQAAGGAVATSPADKADAEAAAVRVLAQMEEGALSAIYNEASPGFRNIGKEADFVGKFRQTLQKTGPLKNPQEVSVVTRPDGDHVLVYRLANDRFVTERRLTFTRSKEGKMELAGLNQHDEPKK